MRPPAAAKPRAARRWASSRATIAPTARRISRSGSRPVSGEARNAIVARAADAVIAVGGEFGTLSEIALALKMGKPVIGLGTWSLDLEGLPGDPLQRAADPAEAVARALEAAERLAGSTW